MELKAFEMRGRVEAVLVTHTFGSIVSTEVEKIQVVRGHGIRGDTHTGTRLADVRETELRAFGVMKGTEIANTREFSAVSAEELAEIAASMELPQNIPHGCLGENLIISGIIRFTEMPPGTLLFFENNREKRSAVLAVWKENGPCQFPGREIQKHFPSIPRLEQIFPIKAKGRRGIVGFVFASGNIGKGNTVTVKVPDQRLYGPY